MACVCAMVTVVDNASSRERNWCGCRLVEYTYEKGGVSEPFIIFFIVCMHRNMCGGQVNLRWCLSELPSTLYFETESLTSL